MKFLTYRILAASAFVLFAAACLGAAATHPAGARYSGTGRITLHRGEPCTSQIMFDFRPINSKAVVWLAAGAHDSAKLTQAAGDRRRVQITGTWRRGLQAGCGYVEVKKFAVETTWWSRLWKK